MGYMVHHAILVTTFDKKLAAIAHQKAVDTCGVLVSEIRESITNGYHSFAIFPDGSKDGWEDSETGDTNRATFIAWMETQRYDDKSTALDWVEVQYGDDNGETKIINDNDAWKREK